jgi:hypothetical protein
VRDTFYLLRCGRGGKRTEERTEGDKDTKWIKERKKEDEGLRYDTNLSPLNYNGIFILVFM